MKKIFLITAELSGGPFDGQIMQIGSHVDEVLMDCGNGSSAVYVWANRSGKPRGLWMLDHIAWIKTPQVDVEIVK